MTSGDHYTLILAGRVIAVTAFKSDGGQSEDRGEIQRRFTVALTRTDSGDKKTHQAGDNIFTSYSDGLQEQN